MRLFPCAGLAATLVLLPLSSLWPEAPAPFPVLSGGTAWAQGAPPPDHATAPPARKGRKQRGAPPDLDESDQLSPRQLDQRPSPATRPARRAAPPAPSDDGAPAAASAPAATSAPRGGDSHAVACSGAFAKESSHLKLAERFDSRNIAFTEVDGPEGSKLMASVLFPNDPKRRLEVLWDDEASRSDTHLIVINGQSTWNGPKGVKLGLALPALEKLNAKPFRMSGFDQPNGGSAIDWQGGALDKVPGGCRVGIRLVPDAKATEAARNEVMGQEFMSNDAKMRAVKPIIAEILIGY
jgi:hypothetical protein